MNLAALDIGAASLAVVVLWPKSYAMPTAPRMVLLDTSGLHALQHLHGTLQGQGVILVLANLNEQPLSLIRRSGFEALLAADHIFRNLPEAVAWSAAHP